MRKFIFGLMVVFQFPLTAIHAQCSFTDVFPLEWAKSAFEVNDYFQNDPRFEVSNDTLRSSAFEHHQDYFRTVRNMNLSFYSYKSANFHECFQSGNITLVCIANDSGLYAYSYQINYQANEREVYENVVDSLKKMMNNRFTYSSNVKNTLKAGDLAGDGVSVYFDDQPIIPNNLTFAPLAIRVGSLAKVPDQESGMVVNKAGEIMYYRLEILYKRPQPKW